MTTANDTPQIPLLEQPVHDKAARPVVPDISAGFSQLAGADSRCKNFLPLRTLQGAREFKPVPIWTTRQRFAG
jgi:hypothetical protein